MTGFHFVMMSRWHVTIFIHKFESPFLRTVHTSLTILQTNYKCEHRSLVVPDLNAIIGNLSLSTVC